MTALGQSDFIRTLQRLTEAHLAAVRAQDEPAIDDALEALTLFWRYVASGRVAEYLARQEEV